MLPWSFYKVVEWGSRVLPFKCIEMYGILDWSVLPALWTSNACLVWKLTTLTATSSHTTVAALIANRYRMGVKSCSQLLAMAVRRDTNTSTGVPHMHIILHMSSQVDKLAETQKVHFCPQATIVCSLVEDPFKRVCNTAAGRCLCLHKKWEKTWVVPSSYCSYLTKQEVNVGEKWGSLCLPAHTHICSTHSKSWMYSLDFACN